MQIVVNIELKQGVLDPQGKAVHHALSALGFGEVGDVRVGKQIILQVEDGDESEVKARVAKMCEELLANTVIENYKIEIA